MNESTEKKKFGLSGSTLKIIAMVTMLIDHIGAAVLLRYILEMRGYFPSIEAYNRLVTVYQVMRSIGRVSFPIYCFLLVEGFQRTRDLKRYILRLGLFAVLTEVPFDLCFSGQFFYPDYQSVMLTLLIGVLTMAGVSLLEKRLQNRLLLGVCGGLVIALGAGGAELLHTDYGYLGVLCIMVLYLLRRNRGLQLAGGCIAFAWELPAPLAFLPIAFYNGKRGLRLKYVFYLFYPVHLLLLYLICVYMGTGSISVV